MLPPDWASGRKNQGSSPTKKLSNSEKIPFPPPRNSPLYSRRTYGIMAAERALYLRRAAGARREPKHHCGECATLGENSISEGYDIMAAERALYLRRAAGARREPKHHCGECATLGENSISEGYDIMAAERALYLRKPVSAFTAESRAPKFCRRLQLSASGIRWNFKDRGEIR